MFELPLNRVEKSFFGIILLVFGKKALSFGLNCESVRQTISRLFRRAGQAVFSDSMLRLRWLWLD